MEKGGKGIGMDGMTNADLKHGADNFTPERIEELRKRIDLSDIPEVVGFSKGHLKNARPLETPVTFRIDSDVLGLS